MFCFKLISYIILVMTLVSANTEASKIQYICEVIDVKSSVYDCSSLSLEWQDLEHGLIEPTRTARSLNLASNKLSSTITNKTFNVFKLLDHTLNLSINSIENIESHGFFFNPDFRNPNDRLNALQITILDLSYNSFQMIPWNSIKDLLTLQKLFMNGNKKITQLNSGDLMDTTEISFMSMTHIYFNSCSIEYVDANVLKHFKSLKFIDLSNNNLYNINERVGNVLDSLGGVVLRLNRNKLECNCKLLWLKKYLLKYNYDDPECFQKILRTDELSPLLIETVSVNLVNNPHDITESRKKKTGFLRNIQKLNKTRNSVMRSIITLDDSEFVCKMKFLKPKKWFQIRERDDRYEISLKCIVQGYPKPNIRWNENNKSLDKKSTYKTFTIEEKELNNLSQTSSYLKTVESSLKFFLVMPIRPSLNGYKNYSCRAMMKTEYFKLTEQSANDTERIDSIQNIVDFKVYHGVDFAYKSWFGSPNSFSTGNTDAALYGNTYYSDTSDLNTAYSKSRERPFIYWIILCVCLIFSLVIVLFATYCIIRNNHKSNKMRQELQFLSHSTYTVNKRSYIYLGTPTTNTRASSAITNTADKSVLSPLKPDNIREHQEYSSIYFNHRSPSKESVHYSNINFLSPSSVLMNGATETFDLNDERSFDGNPIESSPIETLVDSDNSSSKSYDENISEYQDPELIDLRKPGQKIEK